MHLGGRIAPQTLKAALVDGSATVFTDAVAKVVAMPEVKEKLTTMELTVGCMPPAQLASREQAYAQVWKKTSRPTASRRGSNWAACSKYTLHSKKRRLQFAAPLFYFKPHEPPRLTAARRLTYIALLYRLFD